MGRKVRYRSPDEGIHFEGEYPTAGVFLGWGVSKVGRSSGYGRDWNYETVAMIEKPDGTVLKVLPEYIKFVD